jgi:uncharacterized protein YydD (DUF2326 family)
MNKSFFRFVYHDGILEGLDNRKKINFINLTRALCKEFNIQYILTLIEDDSPKAIKGEKISFTKEEISHLSLMIVMEIRVNYLKCLFETIFYRNYT